MQGRDASELLSMPVLTMAQGREVGVVSDVIFDPAAQQLLGMTVAPTRGAHEPMFLALPFVRGVGRDAVTIESENDLQPLSTARRARQVIESGIHLRGASVVTEQGNTLGRVQQVFVDDGGAIAGYTTNTGPLGIGSRTEISREQVVRIGPDALIVREAIAPAAVWPGRG